MTLLLQLQDALRKLFVSGKETDLIARLKLVSSNY